MGGLGEAGVKSQCATGAAVPRGQADGEPAVLPEFSTPSKTQTQTPPLSKILLIHRSY